MESPFFLSDWFSPSVRDMKGVPVKHHNSSSPAPKLVSIPVQFVGSERSRSISALKIQKVFRGFLVRKSVKKISAVKREVDAISKRISMDETVELMKKDSKERLKINELLMSLLFRLDSIRGVDSGVRDCRKSVIKKAIALQEMVDSIVVAGNHFEASIDAVVDSESAKISGQDNWQESEANSIQPVEEQGGVPYLEHSGSSSADHCVDQVAEKHNLTEPTQDSCEPEQTNLPSANEYGEESQTESQSDSSAIPQSLIEGGEEENINSTSVKQEDQEEVKFSGDLARGGEENDRNQELLLGRMLEDNEKMMRLMAELFQRNEMQTRMLCSLSRRVEQLERALTSGQKRKKKRDATGSVDSLESCQDTKKCGKRK